MLTKERLESIAFGSVRQSQDEGVWMARELLALHPSSAANQQVVNLAVENAELKELIDQHANCFTVCPNCTYGKPGDTANIVTLYRSLVTPATDAAITQYRTEGINFAASRLCAAYNNGFLDKPLKEVADVVGMILGAKEDIAQNPASDGLSGEYAEKSLGKYDQKMLRKGAAL